MGFIKAIYLHEDEATAHAEAREAAVNFVRYKCRAPVDDHAGQNDAERERLIDAGYKFYTMDYMPSIGRMGIR